MAKLNKFIKDNNLKTISFLYNNSYLYEDYNICGTRGWIDSNDDESRKILKREILRLELSFKNIDKAKKTIVMMHYPPFLQNVKDIDFIDVLKEHDVTNCVYGHIHGKRDEEICEVENCNIDFKLVSCDYLNFKLYKII